MALQSSYAARPCQEGEQSIPPPPGCNNGEFSGKLLRNKIRMGDQTSSNVQPGAFPPTRWSVVLAARQTSPESADALEAICLAYWYSLYAYLRRCCQSPHDAQDLTQQFLRRLLEKRWQEAAMGCLSPTRS
jgi:hypothetical protein